MEGLKAASYVYHKMIEQNQALEFYSQRNTKLSPNWHRKLYLPNPVPLAKTTPSPTATHDDDLLEEWVDIVVPPYTPPRGFSCSSVFSPTATPPSPYSFQSDHTLSFCSSIMVPASQRQALTVHSLRFPTSRTHTAAGSWQAVSPPTTPALPSGRKACLTDCLSGPSNSQSSAGSSVSPTLLPTSNLHNPITLSQFQNFWWMVDWIITNHMTFLCTWVCKYIFLFHHTGFDKGTTVLYYAFIFYSRVLIVGQMWCLP